jgi:hypothetical protein
LWRYGRELIEHGVLRLLLLLHRVVTGHLCER